METKPRLLLGLGNPTSQYQFTRHNAGRLFIEYLLKESGSSFQTVRQADVFRLPNFFGRSLEKPLLCAQLQCFMNQSGPPLKKLMEKENIKLEEVLIIFDDFAIPFGSLRYRSQGSAGGHNGVKSIIDTFGTNEFGRLRIGIGPLPNHDDIYNDFVLAKFSGDERKNLSTVFRAAQEGVGILLEEGLARAQGYLNKQHI